MYLIRRNKQVTFKDIRFQIAEFESFKHFSVFISRLFYD